ncbi:DUF4192 domain-containing protein [Glycomyces salinus]|uniref:DUF4192 domain-containing protein n=1 Tax=Glycomyces salinus TaxID=980294 RepID=UPI0018ECAABF|nr:DUF4192 domain-containing protein [Glycomyces salinus]
MNDTTPIRLTSPADLLSAIPYLLGFEPEHSLVVQGLRGNNLQCTFRVDLPGGIDHLDHLVTMTEQVKTNDCDAVILIAYGETELATACLDRAASDYAASGIQVLDRLRVTDHHWYSQNCRDGCCPPQGTPLPETTDITTALTVAGARRHPGREAITALLDPADEHQRAAVARAVEDDLAAACDLSWADQCERDLQAVDHWLGSDEPPGPDGIATLGLGLGDLRVRDYALHASDQRRTDTRRPVDLWLWVARHLEDDLAAPSATVAGWCAYRTGNGVLALECFEHALKVCPNYRLAQMLTAALQAGIPPAALDRLTVAADGTEATSNTA